MKALVHSDDLLYSVRAELKLDETGRSTGELELAGQIRTPSDKERVFLAAQRAQSSFKLRFKSGHAQGSSSLTAISDQHYLQQHMLQISTTGMLMYLW